MFLLFCYVLYTCFKLWQKNDNACPFVYEREEVVYQSHDMYIEENTLMMYVYNRQCYVIGCMVTSNKYANNRTSNFIGCTVLSSNKRQLLA